MKPKGSVVLLFFLLLLALDVTAQYDPRKGMFNVGVEGGIQFTDIQGFDAVFMSSSKTGFSLGPFVDYYVTNDFRIRIAANYDSRAFQVDSNLPLADSTGNIGSSYYLYQVDYNLNYLTFPLGLIYTKGTDKFQVLLQVNFYYSLFLSATMNGGEDFYIAPGELGSIPGDEDLLPGHNFYFYDGPATGLAFDFNTRTYLFNSNDYGINFLVGGLYQVTPNIGLNLSLGFTYGLGQVFVNPQLDSKWSQITKLNLGFAYTL